MYTKSVLLLLVILSTVAVQAQPYVEGYEVVDSHQPIIENTIGSLKETECKIDSIHFFWEVIDTLNVGALLIVHSSHTWAYSGVIVDGVNRPYRYVICTGCGLHVKQWKVFYEAGDPAYDKSIKRFTSE